MLKHVYERPDTFSVRPDLVELDVYDSLEEYVGQVKEEGMHHLQSAATRNPARWIGRQGIGSAVAALRMASEVWPEGLEIAEGMTRALESAAMPSPRDRRRRVSWSDAYGDEVDIDRLRSGMDFWRASERQETHGPQTLTIVVDVTTASLYSSTDVLWRGAAAVVLADLLEERGYRCEFWCMQGSNARFGEAGQRDRFQMSAVCLKRCDDPVDRASLLNAVSGWFYRTITFASINTRARGRKVAGGYGGCVTPNKHDLDRISQDEHRVYVSHCYSEADAVALVRRIIEQMTNHSQD